MNQPSFSILFCLFFIDKTNTHTTNSTVAIMSKNPSDGNFSKYKPPINGPLKLPRLKNIPHNKLPVGSNSFGVRSVM